MRDKLKKDPAKTAPKTDRSEDDDRSTKKFVMGMIALIILSVLGGGAVLLWLTGQFIEQSNKNKSQDITIGLLEKKKQALESLKPNYEKINAKDANNKSDASLILNAMPDNQAYDQLIAMIERMGGESGGRVTAIASEVGKSSGTSAGTGAGIGAGGADSYNITVSYDGSYEQTLEFLRKTEKSARVMDFVSMSLGGGIGEAKISPSIILKVYYQGPASIAPTQEPLQ